MNQLKKYLLSLSLLTFLISNVYAQILGVTKVDSTYTISAVNQNSKISAPAEGLWSIATQWEEGWPAGWVHGHATHLVETPEWTIVEGVIPLKEGSWKIRDAYRVEDDRIKCIRRYHWTGEETLEKVALAIRWQVEGTGAQAFLPNILYYGNPSGEKNGKERVPFFHGETGEEALFEEHRFTMPFASLESGSKGNLQGAALHSIPSLVPGGNIPDQWWSLGTLVKKEHTELVLMSGPIAYNGQRNAAKALQGSSKTYGDTYMKVPPGTIIEKTFYLEVFPVEKEGTAFQRPIYTSIDLFKPFYTEDLPKVEDIIKAKFQFAKSRWIEGPNYAGFNMYPDHVKPRIVLGWAGQSEALTYALQPLSKSLGNQAEIDDMVQRAMDHICTSPIGPNGFPVRYEVVEDRWHSPDPVSEGQAMNSIAMAINAALIGGTLKIEGWKEFLKKACDVHAERLLRKDWDPINTAEAFYIKPLLLASAIFKEEKYVQAALKATNYYAKRHLDMREPYWGGTLDATCEDKEGAWGAFQGFLAAFEHTKDEKYLQYAQHAGDVVLSYTVVWDIPLPAGRMNDHFFKTRGWTGVSPQNQHLDVYGVLMTPAIYKLGTYTNNRVLQRLAAVMYRSCGQMIDPLGAHGEQLQQTNFAQHGDFSNIYKFRGGYSERWTVFWITAHFLHAAAQFSEMGVRF